MGIRGNNAIIEGFDDEKDDGLSIFLESCEKEPGCIKIHLNNRIDNYNSAFFQRAVGKVVEAGYRHLLFCCSGLSYVSSTGIGAFTFILKTLQTGGSNMALLGVQSRVYDIFELLGFTSFFSFFGREEEALSALRGTKAEAPKPNAFPLIFTCPKCSKKLKTSKPGKYSCSACKTKIVVGSNGNVRIWDGVS